MTKCIVLGENIEEKKNKPVELIYRVYTSHERCKQEGSIEKARTKPRQFEFVELAAKGDIDKYDVIIAHDGDRKFHNLYLGHWNDGVAE